MAQGRVPGTILSVVNSELAMAVPSAAAWYCCPLSPRTASKATFLATPCIGEAQTSSSERRIVCRLYCLATRGKNLCERDEGTFAYIISYILNFTFVIYRS